MGVFVCCRDGRQRGPAADRGSDRCVQRVQLVDPPDDEHAVRRVHGGRPRLVRRRLGWSAGLQARRQVAAVWRRQSRQGLRASQPPRRLHRRRQVPAVDRRQDRRSAAAAHVHCVSKKQDTKLLPITSPNGNRFSKFFHWQTHW